MGVPPARLTPCSSRLAVRLREARPSLAWDQMWIISGCAAAVLVSSDMTDIGWWQAVKAAGGQVPPERPFHVLLAELEEMLGRPEGAVRDGLGFELLGGWVIAGHCDYDLIGLGRRMAAATQIGLGTQGDDTVFKRSFAALMLGLVVERDIIVAVNTGEHLLEPDEVFSYADAGLHWMAGEKDLRGAVDPRRGVAHAIAHGADFVASLARHPYVDTAAAQILLQATLARIEDTAGITLLLSEDERLAYATMALLHRGDITATDLAKELQPLRSLAALRHRIDLDPRAHARLNALNWLRALYLQLDIGVKPMPWYARDGHFDRRPAAQEPLRETVREALLEFSLWFAG